MPNNTFKILQINKHIKKEKGLLGQKLVNYYELAKEIGGVHAQLKLAILTMVTSKKAVDLPDSPDLIKKFENSIEIIKNEFKK